MSLLFCLFIFGLLINNQNHRIGKNRCLSNNLSLFLRVRKTRLGLANQQAYILGLPIFSFLKLNSLDSWSNGLKKGTTKKLTFSGGRDGIRFKKRKKKKKKHMLLMLDFHGRNFLSLLFPASYLRQTLRAKHDTFCARKKKFLLQKNDLQRWKKLAAKGCFVLPLFQL